MNLKNKNSRKLIDIKELDLSNIEADLKIENLKGWNPNCWSYRIKDFLETLSNIKYD